MCDTEDVSLPFASKWTSGQIQNETMENQEKKTSHPEMDHDVSFAHPRCKGTSKDTNACTPKKNEGQEHRSIRIIRKYVWQEQLRWVLV